jgi:hypothetical protein
MHEHQLIEASDDAVLSVIEVNWFRRRHQRPGGTTVNTKPVQGSGPNDDLTSLSPDHAD